MAETNLPKINDLYGDITLAKSNDLLTALLNQPPKPEWIKIHPYIAGYKYLPIDKIEFLLKKIFKKYRVEILREGVAFNAVFVVVRVHYLNPITTEWDYHDGIGSKEVQVKKGASPADLSQINPGALAMAFPIAKTVAIKDACDHFGTLFGSDLNRKDVMSISVDDKLQRKDVIDEINEMVAKKEPVMQETHAFEEINDIHVNQPETVTETPELPTAAAPPPPDEDDDF